ncbi:FAD-dependent oxidoreductase [Nocardia sp. NPDC059239]|uniref:FAD-dependent oxidoreductase n=1 Tax=unclassified Nocardia TaxID=2637762 RepID=UPI0036B69D3C
MAHVILGHCCKDVSCLNACPRDCIRPRPGDTDFATTPTLHIDPNSCIDCTACVDACPTSAIKADHALTATEQHHLRRNSDYFANTRPRTTPGRRPATPLPRPSGVGDRRPRIAVVGAGPAAMYTIRELLRRSSFVDVTVYERHAHLGGLLRTAIAPDTGLREMLSLFDVPFGDDRVHVVYNTEIGRDLSLDALRRRFDAVVFAHGASIPRPLTRSDSTMPAGVYDALDVLAGVNNPSPTAPPTLGPHCLIVGGGNVALEVIRHLAHRHSTSPSIAALTQVTVLSRACADRSAFATPAMQDILALPNLSIHTTRTLEHEPGSAADQPLRPAMDHLANPNDRDDTRLPVVFCFEQHVTNIESTGTGELTVYTTGGHTFLASTVVRAIGFRTAPIDGLPETHNGQILNRNGRVISPTTRDPLRGVYVVGWAKRGAHGGIGENRVCAAETVEQLAIDLHLTRPTHQRGTAM